MLGVKKESRKAGAAKTTLFCSFCGKSQHEVHKLIAGPSVFICNECVDLCNEIVAESDSKFPPTLDENANIGRRAFYVCPFSEPFDTIYRVHIRPLLTSRGWTVERADDVYQPGAVMEQIWRFIRECDLVIADVTDRNPNVMYEVGLAHALGKPAFVIAQCEEDIPFDLRQHRYILYRDTAEGHENVALKIAVALDSSPTGAK